MEIPTVLNSGISILKSNAPVLLTASAVAGLVSTVALTIKGTIEAETLLNEYYEEHDTGFPLSLKEKIPIIWKAYLPAGISFGITVLCIVGAHGVNTRKQAAIAGAYSLTEKAFSEYKEKVVSELGKSKDAKIRDVIAKDRMATDPVSTKEVIIAGGEVLCYESITGRYFMSDVQTIRTAENEINSKILEEMSSSLNDFFYKLGLPNTSIGEELGWSMDNKLDIQLSSMMSEDSRPCMVVGYSNWPERNYYRINS